MSSLAGLSCRPGVVWHLPHDATCIPDEVREQFVLSDAELAYEVLRMTDHATGRLFGLDPRVSSVIRAPISRLVVDVERFPDDAEEPMAARGMGVIYTRTADGRPLRLGSSAQERQTLLDRWYWPHHLRLEEAVHRALDEHGRCLVIDCHSFPAKPLPYEQDQSPDRPEICLGSDDFHTSAELLAAAVAAFQEEGFSVAINRPFSGALVPSSRYRHDKRVSALMVEVNRGLYLHESTGSWLAAAPALAIRIIRALNNLTNWNLRGKPSQWPAGLDTGCTNIRPENI